MSVPTYPQNTVITDVDGTNEVQSVKVDGTSGTFTLSYDGDTTDALAFDISAANLAAALEGLQDIEDVSVTGGPGNSGGTTPYVVTFLDPAALDAELLGDADELAGGGADVTVTEVTKGESVEDSDAVQLGTGNADGTTLTSPLENPSPAAARAADGEDYGDE